VNRCGRAAYAKPFRELTVVAFVDGRFGVAFFESTPYVPGKALRKPPCRDFSRYLKKTEEALG